MDRPCCFNNHKQALQPARIACVDSRIESGGKLGSVNSNLERHARQDHMVRITRGNGCQARMPQRLSLYTSTSLLPDPIGGHSVVIDKDLPISISITKKME